MVMLSKGRRSSGLLGVLIAAAAAGVPAGVAAQPASVDEVIEARTSYQDDARASQQRVEDLDDETLALIARYNGELERHQDLLTYNANLRELLANQEREKERLAQELSGIEVVRQDIVPLMVEMVDVLGQFIELDQPMLLDERKARLEKLKANLTRSDVELAEKYRRLLEAYQIEAEYGQSLEAYEGTIEVDGVTRTVDFLRVGRVGLYYMSLDRHEAGIWNPLEHRWQTLPDSDLDAIDFAIRVARKQAPPNLFEIPLWTETGG
jgi:hypothetical protein